MPSPDQIGRYRVERRLGSGAFAVVWLAHDDRLQAPVAVKVMAENWAGRLDIRERFLAEARILRKATSGGVIQVFDIGEPDDERPYFVMEYAERGTLADRVTAGPLAVPEALRLTAQAARGVRTLHEVGVVHRDIKPSNILLAGGGTAGRERVLVADLGLAKNLAQASGMTVVAGSIGYMAPEQAEPFDGIDARADVYSLGAVLYHLVTGTVPGPPGRILPPDRLRPDLPPEVGHAIARAMDPDRERRWPTAHALAGELDRIGAGEPGPVRPDVPSPTGPTSTMPGPEPGPGREQVSLVRAQAGPTSTMPDPAPGPEAGTGAGGAPPSWAVSPERRPRRRRRAITIGVAAAVLVGAGAGGVAAVRVLDDPPPPSEVRVRDATDRISVEIPTAWAKETIASGWRPASLGLSPSRHAPGLIVAQDASHWSDLTSTTNGVFVGLGTGGKAGQRGKRSRNRRLTRKVGALRHRGCPYAGSRAFRSDAWRGRIHSWSSCASSGHSLEEIALTSTHPGVPPVYVQIRCDNDCSARTDQVLRSLRVSAA